MILTKEVDYIFEFQGRTNIESHYIDNIESRRYVWNNKGTGDSPSPTPFRGTNNPYKEIYPKLIGSYLISENDRGENHYLLVYGIPDINKTAIVRSQKYMMGDIPSYVWACSMIDKLEEAN